MVILLSWNIMILFFWITMANNNFYSIVIVTSCLCVKDVSIASKLLCSDFILLLRYSNFLNIVFIFTNMGTWQAKIRYLATHWFLQKISKYRIQQWTVRTHFWAQVSRRGVPTFLHYVTLKSVMFHHNVPNQRSLYLYLLYL